MTDHMQRELELLLVEDNPGDVRLIVEGLKDSHVRHRLSVAHDGVEALELLARRGAYADAPRPDLIVLDLNLPKKDGREVLVAIKADAELKTIPVVIFSSSQADADVAASYALNANCYIMKPIELDRFLSAVKAIEDFWLSVAALPPRFSPADTPAPKA